MIPKRKEQVGALTLHIYGFDKAARPYYEGMEQGYYVEKDGRPTARGELTVEELQAPGYQAPFDRASSRARTAMTQYLTDGARHLICVPYSREGLHQMADALGIHRCWFHSGSKYPHYDIPKRRIAEIEAKCRIVSTQEILRIIKASQN